MSRAVAIQMDPIEAIDIDADSTFVLALEAQRRGHGLYHYLPQALTFNHGRVYARAQALSVRREPGNFASLGTPCLLSLASQRPQPRPTCCRCEAGATARQPACRTQAQGRTRKPSLSIPA